MMIRPMLPPFFKPYNYYSRMNANNTYRRSTVSPPESQNIHQDTVYRKIDKSENYTDTNRNASADSNKKSDKETKKILGIEFPINIFGFELDLDDIIIIGLIAFLIFFDSSDDDK